MKLNEYKLHASVWLYPGMGGWHFVTIPAEVSEQIREGFGDMKRGWGSLPVEATVGSTTWKTSIFPDKESGAYLLPLKADIRKKEKIAEGDEVSILLQIDV
jgi:hypothetical protein